MDKKATMKLIERFYHVGWRGSYFGVFFERMKVGDTLALTDEVSIKKLGDNKWKEVKTVPVTQITKEKGAERNV